MKNMNKNNQVIILNLFSRIAASQTVRILDKIRAYAVVAELICRDLPSTAP